MRKFANAKSWTAESFEIVAAVYDCRIRKTIPGAHRDAASANAHIGSVGGGRN